jgi:hypothetical protein
LRSIEAVDEGEVSSSASSVVSQSPSTSSASLHEVETGCGLAGGDRWNAGCVVLIEPSLGVASMDDSDEEDIAEQLMVLLMSWNKDDLKQNHPPRCWLSRL